jgi:hypothetical protein
MIGDLILWFKRIVKQHITCKHDYQPCGIPLTDNWMKMCIKCNKIK